MTADVRLIGVGVASLPVASARREQLQRHGLDSPLPGAAREGNHPPAAAFVPGIDSPPRVGPRYSLANTSDAPTGVLAMVRACALRPKLTPPQATGHEIPRAQICERIFAAGAAKLVLLRAPAGFGKTTAMLQVYERLAETGLSVAWLTLDRADNDVSRFLYALSAALARTIPELATGQEIGASPDELAFAVIDRVAAAPTPFVLFLDDFEALQNPTALAIIDELIDQLPRGCQLIVGSRGVPELRLGRLRARGRLVEVEPSHLRFSEDEVDSFLRGQRRLPLAEDDVRQLHRSTEGWAAALWLASISLENREEPARFIASFSGSNAAVASYLLEDVLGRQDEDLRHFLLQTSLLAELNASLCDAICGRSDSAHVLRRLEKGHLFLLPLRGNGDHYRYHGMFAEFLRMQLTRDHPDEVATVHRAAACWYHQRGRTVPAIEHALAAKDLAFALSELLQHGQRLLEEGRVRLLSRWLDPLQDTGALDGLPLLQVFHAWAVCMTRGPRGPRGAQALLDRIEQQPGCIGEVKAHCLAMRPLLLSLADRMEEALPLAAQALQTLPHNVSFVSGFLEVSLVNLATIAGRFEDALRFAEAARARQMAHDSPFHNAVSGAAEAAVDLVHGRLRKAIGGLRIAVSASGPAAARPTNGNVLAGIPLAQALYEAGEVEQAERLLVVYLPLIGGVAIPDELITGHVVMARIVAECGDIERAEEMLAELEHIGRREGLQRVVASAGLERARMLTVAGRLAQAKAELDRCGDQALWARVARQSLRANEVETHAVALARWSVRCDRAASVMAMLSNELQAAELTRRDRRALTLRLLLAQAFYREGQRGMSMQLLLRAVSWAQAEGYVRPFHVEGALLKVMLSELRASDLSQEASAHPETLAFIDRLLSVAPGEPALGVLAVPTARPSVRPTGAAPELLTRKELQVLRLASEGLSNDQIAERLFVAETTVRTHLRNINVKLETRNRVEAIVSARRLGLIT